MLTEVSRRLLDWYERASRCLPWRGSQDPYAVWVSEIMLQQTRVETVIPYFQRWMEHFPTLRALANAPEQDVLREWEGLGYYSRARNLHKAAGLVVTRFDGVLPSQPAGLQALPGVGAYTAGAIASMAFGLDEATLDGNIRRVLSRVFNLEIPARSPQGERVLWSLAREHLPPGRAGDYNQAWMDLGSLVCTPQKPTCLLCPLAEVCRARALGVQEQRPILPVKDPIPHYTVTAAVIRRGELVLIARRPQDGLLGGMWEFPEGKREDGESLPDCLRREIREELATEIEVGNELGIFRHAYTHFKVTLHAFDCTLAGLDEPQALQVSELRWVRPDELDAFPMGKIDRQISRRLHEDG
jgi:A/G-specific adenine glycosylase